MLRIKKIFYEFSLIVRNSAKPVWKLELARNLKIFGVYWTF